ncbi:MAG: general secretion pathway protein GspB [Chromatiales bacterium]|jgi:general secretion pathway protein B|nr:general secretion pathway protein GspB [Chromatiales bacterium]
MSFILDALRKSDAERQRQSAPGLADIRYARPKARRSPWVPLLVVVLGANLAFMAFQWWRSGTAPAAAPGTAVAPGALPPAPAVPTAPATAPVTVVPDPSPPAARTVPVPVPPEVRPLAGEADPAAVAALPDAVDDPDLAGLGDELAAAAGVDAAALAADAEAMAAASAPAPPAPSRIREEAGLPTSQQLIAAGTLRVPELSLELHVYSDDPAGRFIIINGRRYREGATLNEGPVVESITTEGAVLDSQGTRFIVLPK